MIDGIYLGERVILVALGIDAKGVKHVLGLREGATENARVVKSLLSDLIARGLDAHARRLWVIDGAKALRSAIVELFGALAHIHRCQEHKRRNVIDHLPQAMQAGTSRAMRQAWDAGNASLAKRRLEALAGSLQAQHPGAASSLREGLDETLTLQALGITGRCTERCARPTRSKISTARSPTTRATSGAGATARWCSAGLPVRSPMRDSDSGSCADIAT